MVVGLGAVATTMIAGVEAVRRGLAKPIGSLTQMGTIRLGKRTDNNSPLIKDFVPLANLNDIVFTGWDIFEDNVYESAAHAKVLEKRDAGAAEAVSGEDQAAAGGLRPVLREAPARHAREEGQEQARSGRPGDRRHPGLQEDGGPRGDDLVRVDGDLHGADGGASVDRGIREGPGDERHRHCAVADLRLCGAERGRAVCQWRAEPDGGYAGDDRALEEECGADLRQGLQDRADVYEDGAGAGLQGAHAGRLGLVLDQHPGQPRRRSAGRSAVVQDQGRVEARLARIHLPAGALSRSLQATSTTRFASTTTRRAATKKRRGTTSTSSAGWAIRCRSR